MSKTREHTRISGLDTMRRLIVSKNYCDGCDEVQNEKRMQL